jgi:Oxidoreductase family, C-terminal alpha/beta domain
VTRVFGTPATVYAAGSRKFREGYGDLDQVTMLLRYESGLVGMLSHSDCLFEAQNHFHIHGSQGVISWAPDRIALQRPGLPERVIELPAENPYTTMWRALAAAWRAGAEPSYTAERALRDLMVIELVHQSITGGAQIAAVRSDLIAA